MKKAISLLILLLIFSPLAQSNNDTLHTLNIYIKNETHDEIKLIQGEILNDAEYGFPPAAKLRSGGVTHITLHSPKSIRMWVAYGFDEDNLAGAQASYTWSELARNMRKAQWKDKIELGDIKGKFKATDKNTLELYLFDREGT